MNDGIPGRGLKSAAALAVNVDHGVRIRYVAGCRCFKCRRSNSDYERGRIAARICGDWNGIVPAARARRRLTKLRSAGIGRRAVRAATDIGDTVLQEIITGKKKNIRARTERLILAVTNAAAFDGAYVSAARTWNQINQLRREGFTKRRISAEIGKGGRCLQFGKKRITVRNAAAVDRMWRKYMTPAQV